MYHERGGVVPYVYRILSLGAIVRIDTLTEPMPDDIDDIGLRAASLARGEKAVAMIEADEGTVFGATGGVGSRLSTSCGPVATR